MLSSRLVRAAASAAGGVALGVGFPPAPVWPLVVVGVALLIAATAGTTAATGAWLGLLAGFVFFSILLSWLDVIGVDAWFGLAAFQALYWLPLGAGLALVSRLRFWPLWACGVWVGVELVRSSVPLGGFPWGRLAFGVTDSPMLSYAALAGTAAIGAAVVLLASTTVASVRAILGREWAVAGASAAAGIVVLAAAPQVIPLVDAEGAPRVQAAIIQGNVPQAGLGFLGEPRQVLANHADAMRALAGDVAAGRAPAPDIVIWPENSSDIDPFTDAAAFAEIDSAVRAIDAPTLVGAVLETDDPSLVENSGIVWDPVTGPGERYVKRHPVPFGEYIPFRDLLAPLIERFDQIPRDFAAGDEPGILQLGPAVIGDVICFEVAYDGLVGDVVQGGAEVVVVQTNNATYARTGQPDQQFAMSRLRAVEHGRTVLVAATSGISGVVSPDGTVEHETAELVAATIGTQVPLLQESTIATTLGSWPGWVLAAMGAGAVAIAWRREGRARSPAPREVDRSDPVQT